MLIVPNQPGTRKPYSKSLAVSSAMSSPLCSCHWLNGSFEPNTAIEAGDMPRFSRSSNVGSDSVLASHWQAIEMVGSWPSTSSV